MAGTRRDIWRIDAYPNPTFGPGVFDHLRSLFRRFVLGGFGHQSQTHEPTAFSEVRSGEMVNNEG